MDSAAFRTRLDGIHRLDTSQRGQAVRALMLAEAGIPGGVYDDGTRAASEPTCPPPTGGDETSGGAVGQPDLMAGIGRSRLARIGCPHCDSDEIRPWSKAGGKPRYRCAACGRTFNPLTGTPLSGLHYPDRWRADRESGGPVRRRLHHRVPLAAPVPEGPHAR